MSTSKGISFSIKEFLNNFPCDTFKLANSLILAYTHLRSYCLNDLTHLAALVITPLWRACVKNPLGTTKWSSQPANVLGTFGSDYVISGTVSCICKGNDTHDTRTHTRTYLLFLWIGDWQLTGRLAGMASCCWHGGDSGAASYTSVWLSTSPQGDDCNWVLWQAVGKVSESLAWRRCSFFLSPSAFSPSSIIPSLSRDISVSQSTLFLWKSSTTSSSKPSFWSKLLTAEVVISQFSMSCTSYAYIFICVIRLSTPAHTWCKLTDHDTILATKCFSAEARLNAPRLKESIELTILFKWVWVHFASTWYVHTAHCNENV